MTAPDVMTDRPVRTGEAIVEVGDAAGIGGAKAETRDGAVVGRGGGAGVEASAPNSLVSTTTEIYTGQKYFNTYVLYVKYTVFLNMMQAPSCDVLYITTSEDIFSTKKSSFY